VDLERPGPQLDLLALSEAIDRLAAAYPRAAAVVKLRFFGGLTRQQAAAILGISTTTADDDWAYAKSRLRLELAGPAGVKPRP
jgi:DNA-directed RNA polymerase specialized sigma24 family protein